MSPSPLERFRLLKDLQLLLVGLSSALLAALFFLAFVACFRSGLFAGPVMFYRGIKIIIALCFLFGALAVAGELVGRYAYRAFGSLAGAFLAIIASACLALCFFVVIPVTLDRSVTTFILSRMAPTPGQPPREFSKEEIAEILRTEYIEKRDAVGRRMAEQAISGNVICAESGCRLSEQGEGFLEFSVKIARLFGMNTDFIQGSQVER